MACIVIRLCIALWIIIDDLMDQKINIVLLLLWCISCFGKTITLGSIMYGLLYLMFCFAHQCGFADVILIVTCCMDRSLVDASWLNLVACLIAFGIIIFDRNKSKGKVALPFAPSLLISHGLLLLIQQIIQ